MEKEMLKNCINMGQNTGHCALFEDLFTAPFYG
jgi:hypothetical protein